MLCFAVLCVLCCEDDDRRRACETRRDGEGPRELRLQTTANTNIPDGLPCSTVHTSTSTAHSLTSRLVPIPRSLRNPHITRRPPCITTPTVPSAASAQYWTSTLVARPPATHLQHSHHTSSSRSRPLTARGIPTLHLPASSAAVAGPGRVSCVLSSICTFQDNPERPYHSSQSPPSLSRRMNPSALFRRLLAP